MPDPSFILPLFLQSALLPFAVAGAVLSASPTLARRSRGMQAPSWTAAMAVTLGFLACYIAVLHAQWSLQPRQALDWLPWTLLCAGVAALLTERLSRRGSRLLARAAISLAAAALTAWPALPGAGPKVAAAAIAVTALLVFAAWSGLARPALGRSASALPLMIAAGAAALALMLDSSQLIGQLAGALAATLAAGIAVGLLKPQAAFSGAATGIAVLLLGVLLLHAHLYAGFPLAYIALLASGLLAACAVEAAAARQERHPARAWMVSSALCAVPALVMIGLAVKAAQDSGGY